MSTGNNPKKNQQKAKTARQIEQENEQRTAMNAEAIPFTPKGVTQSHVPASESSKEMRSKIVQGRKNSPQQGSATKDTSSGSRGFAGFIPEEETSSSRDNAREAQGAIASPPTESSATNAMSPTQPLVTTRADSQDAAVEKQPSTETAELLSEEDEDIEASGSDPQQPLEGNDSPSVFFDGSQEMDMLRATLVKLKNINREEGGALDAVNKM
eukprot:gene14578-16153_t